MLQLTIYHDLSLILNPEANEIFWVLWIVSSNAHKSFIPQFIKAPFHCFTMLPAFSSNFFFALKRRFITPHLTEPTWQSGNRVVASVHWVHPLLPVSLHPKHTLDPSSWSLKSDEQCTTLCDLRTPAVAFKTGDIAATKKTHIPNSYMVNRDEGNHPCTNYFHTLMWATKKTLITFHCTGWLIGILIMVYYNPYIPG